MVNVADLFQLFGEIAGVDVRKVVPKSRLLDSVSMLPYLTNPSQASLRAYNFTQTGINISAHDERPGPCVITLPASGPAIVNTCVQLFPQKALCETEGGTWYGVGATPTAYASCCDLLQAMPQLGFDILPLSQAAVRNDQFKLIQETNANCSSSAPAGSTTTELQLYRIDEAPVLPLLDFTRLNLITDQNNPTSGLTPEQAVAFRDLNRELSEILNSEAACPGDGNVDGVVDWRDIANWARFRNKGSSWYDFDLPVTNGYDALTNDFDLKFILENLGRTCPPR
jgi:hypothetical protein